jgi:hypothetical protein
LFLGDWVPTFRSSIFSFDTLQLEKARPKGFFRALVLTLALVLVAEIGARLLVNRVPPYGEYWEAQAGLEFEAYRQHIVQGQTPRTVIIGDSTARCAIDPQALQVNLPEAADIYTLARPANYPMACRCTTLPLLSAPYTPPKLVIASFSPYGFVKTDRLETQILDSPICRKTENPLSYHGEFRLLWLMRTLPYLKNLGAVNEQLKLAWEQRGFTPLMESAPQQNEDTSGANLSEKTAPIQDERVQVVRDLALLARNRNFKLVLVVPPLKKRDRVVEEYVERMSHLAQELDFTLLDFSTSPFLLTKHFLDGVHLNKDGAEIFSQELGRKIYSQTLETACWKGQRDW